jgi:putative ABC transport system permease protein
MRSWLAGFDQRIVLSPLFFLAASLLALAVASLTVVAQSLRLARAEPARALRHE